MNVTVKQILKNDLIEHLNRVLYRTFLDMPMSFVISYFIGENDQKKDFLCITISSGKTAEIIYKRVTQIPLGKVYSDIEAEFVDDVLNEIFIAGIGLFNIEYIRKKGKDGKESLLNTVINLN